jgi:epoxyqueuosine reductase
MDEFIIVSTMNHVEKLTRDVKQHALEIGFSEVGVADARHLLSLEADRYQEWLSLGYHGTMSYLERNAGKRENLDEILPGARSVIVVTQNYYTPFTHEKHEEYPDEFGKISRYAWGDDYHEVIPPKLRQVAAFIERLSPGSESKIYTDTGPILGKSMGSTSRYRLAGKTLKRDIQVAGIMVFYRCHYHLCCTCTR